MSVESLGYRAGLLFFKCLHFFEKRSEGLGIVPGFVKVFDSQEVGFGLEPTRELQERKRHPDSGEIANRVSHSAPYKNQRNGREIKQLPPSVLSRNVARRDVCDLVSHHPG